MILLTLLLYSTGYLPKFSLPPAYSVHSLKFFQVLNSMDFPKLLWCKLTLKGKQEINHGSLEFPLHHLLFQSPTDLKGELTFEWTEHQWLIRHIGFPSPDSPSAGKGMCELSHISGGWLGAAGGPDLGVMLSPDIPMMKILHSMTQPSPALLQCVPLLHLQAHVILMQFQLHHPHHVTAQQNDQR